MAPGLEIRALVGLMNSGGAGKTVILRVSVTQNAVVKDFYERR